MVETSKNQNLICETYLNKLLNQILIITYGNKLLDKILICETYRGNKLLIQILLPM